jgi:hypothetical protein
MKKTKGPKQNKQKRLGLPIPEGDEKLVFINYMYLKNHISIWFGLVWSNIVLNTCNKGSMRRQI